MASTSKSYFDTLVSQRWSYVGLPCQHVIAATFHEPKRYILLHKTPPELCSFVIAKVIKTQCDLDMRLTVARASDCDASFPNCI